MGSNNSSNSYQARMALVNYLHAIYPVDRNILAAFADYWVEVRVARKELLTREGETQRCLYFVAEGIQRSYYIRDGKEFTIAFTYPPSFTGIPESFFTQQPSRYFLQCMTPGRLLRLSFEQYEALMDTYPPLERMSRKATELVLAGFAERYYELLALPMEERFLNFAKRSPHLFTMIPHKYLASYLGIDPTNFSKLLNRIRL